ncbi:hypothetical protein F9Q47_23435 [Salmonella enterica subsp. enterica serovar Typhimurium]|nr:hypothetical protein [Salmonella enterica subsp. enterica serovar Typhimurium]
MVTPEMIEFEKELVFEIQELAYQFLDDKKKSMFNTEYQNKDEALKAAILSKVVDYVSDAVFDFGEHYQYGAW